MQVKVSNVLELPKDNSRLIGQIGGSLSADYIPVFFPIIRAAIGCISDILSPCSLVFVVVYLPSKMRTLTIVLIVSLAATAWAQSPVGDVVGKLVVGYQGWFSAPNDQSPMNHWVHWSGQTPAAGHVTFEVYPDVREYTHTYQTNLGALGNGQPAKLFSSWDQQTVDTHFKWMAENNIDTAALQRFAGGVKRDIPWR
jgi:hypothetical protein